MRILIAIFLTLLLSQSACKHSKESRRVIVLQPFSKFLQEEAQHIATQIRLLGAEVILKGNINIPKSCYYSPRDRYRADSLIRYLSKRVGKDSIIAGILNEDISTTKGDIQDWGVMGLGYRPGNACIISSFRINKSKRAEQLYKVIVHELGHSEGLDHCPEKTCLMRDAEGGNPLNEEKGFCERCTAYLKRKGWNF